MRIIIPGNPIPKARPKFAFRGKHAITYDPQNMIKAFAKEDLIYRLEEWFIVNDHARSSFKASFRAALSVSLWFLIPLAESLTMAQKNAKLWNIDDSFHSKKDIDNFVKFYFDVANRILWHDDAQVVELYACQKYSENPCTIIDVCPIKNLMTEKTKKIAKIFSPKELEILNVHLSVLKNALAQFESCPEDEKTFMAEHASLELIAFANEYAQKLNKIRDK